MSVMDVRLFSMAQRQRGYVASERPGSAAPAIMDISSRGRNKKSAGPNTARNRRSSAKIHEFRDQTSEPYHTNSQPSITRSNPLTTFGFFIAAMSLLYICWSVMTWRSFFAPFWVFGCYFLGVKFEQHHPSDGKPHPHLQRGGIRRGGYLLLVLLVLSSYINDKNLLPESMPRFSPDTVVWFEEAKLLSPMRGGLAEKKWEDIEKNWEKMEKNWEEMENKSGKIEKKSKKITTNWDKMNSQGYLSVDDWKFHNFNIQNMHLYLSNMATSQVFGGLFENDKKNILLNKALLLSDFDPPYTPTHFIQLSNTEITASSRSEYIMNIPRIRFSSLLVGLYPLLLQSLLEHLCVQETSPISSIFANLAGMLPIYEFYLEAFNHLSQWQLYESANELVGDPSPDVFVAVSGILHASGEEKRGNKNSGNQMGDKDLGIIMGREQKYGKIGEKMGEKSGEKMGQKMGEKMGGNKNLEKKIVKKSNFHTKWRNIVHLYTKKGWFGTSQNAYLKKISPWGGILKYAKNKKNYRNLPLFYAPPYAYIHRLTKQDLINMAQQLIFLLILTLLAVHSLANLAHSFRALRPTTSNP